MAKAISANTKSRGRPVTTGTSPLIGVRLPADQVARLDKWAKAQPDDPSRPEAIRRLVEKALSQKG